MRHLPSFCARSFSILAVASIASVVGLDAHAYNFDDVEEAYQANYLATPVTLTGRIVDELGQPVDGVQLSLLAWGDNIDNDGEATSSWGDGSFSMPGLARRNALLKISAAGYYGEVVPISLQVELGETQVDLGDIALTSEQFGRVRMTFGGDAMFDRRMYEEGVINEGSRASDTRALFQFVEEVLHSDDHTVVNLETAVTADLSTAHPNKSYIFAAHPDIAAELPGVGIDSVALGNNHIFDYMEDGVADTLFHLQQIGLPHYGAGMSRELAYQSTYRPTINGVGLTMQSFSNFTGYSYGGEDMRVVAYDDPDKGGALPSYTSVIDRFLEDETGLGNFTMAMIHGGTEYALAQSDGTHNDFERFVEGGTDLVIAHHPHVAHGVSIINTVDGPRYVFGSLGNFVFDQDIYETMRSYLAIVDVAETGEGPEVERVQLAPIRIDDYAPRLMAGAALEGWGRTLAHYSTEETEVSGFDRAVIFAEGGRLIVSEEESDVSATDLLDARAVTVAGGSTGNMGLEPYTGTDALASLSTSAPASCELGRDLLVIGDFEELDVDDGYAEDGHWDTSSARRLQGAETHAGTGAAVLLRKSSNSSRTSLRTHSRVQVYPQHNMTIRGWHKGQNAGEFRVTVRWMTAGGSTVQHTTEYTNPGGDFDWTLFEIDTVVPDDAYDLKVYYRMYPPEAGDEGELFLDDLEYVDWDPDAVAVDAQGTDLPTPNAWDYVRCAAADGPLDVELTHRVYETML